LLSWKLCPLEPHLEILEMRDVRGQQLTGQALHFFVLFHEVSNL
jgi:hypothetical protein